MSYSTLRDWIFEYDQEYESIQGHWSHYSHTSLEQREEIVRRAIRLFQEEGMNTTEATERLSRHHSNLKRSTLHRWLNTYEKEHGPIPGRRRRR